MAADEELRNDYDPTIRRMRESCFPAALNAARCTFSHHACYDEARIGFADRAASSPPAIREKASLMVSVVFFAEMCRRRVAFEAV
jgi:hypothetical protein